MLRTAQNRRPLQESAPDGPPMRRPAPQKGGQHLLYRLIIQQWAVFRNKKADTTLKKRHPFLRGRLFSCARGAGGAGRSASVFERIAKEGRKFGLSLLLASQRPSELSETVVAQCGTVIAHRLTHEADQRLLRHATALGSRALLDQLPSLAQQHALVTGVSTGVPVAVRVRDVQNPPKSDDPKFIDIWNDSSKLDTLPEHIDNVVRDWQGELP